MKKALLVIGIIFMPIMLLAQSSEFNVTEIVSKMTLEEKAKLVVGVGMRFPGAPAPAVGVTQNKVPGAAGTTFPIPQLNVPSMVLADGPAGLRINPTRENDSTKTYYATAFPIATLLASSWDTELVKNVGQAIGKEVLEYGVDIILMPALNLHRNPLCGRNFEYYSEDPLLNGCITAAMVNGVQSNGVGTSIKHFAANNQEKNRNSVNTIVTERALRELYLKGFEIAVKKSNPWTVMSSYNKINGLYTSESHDLLTKILRTDWNFKGFVMTDWFGGKDAVAQMKAGNDLLMPGNPKQTEKIIEAVNNGDLDVETLDTNVKRILNIIALSPVLKNYAYSDEPDLKTHAQIARAAATEGMVLLKNEGEALPLATSNTIALFGNSSYSIQVGGTGSGDVNEAYSIPLIDGLKNAGYKPEKSVNEAYLNYIKETKAKQPKPKRMFMLPPPIPQMPAPIELIGKTAEETDVAMITIGRNSGEFSDRKLEGDFNLDSLEIDLIKAVSEAFHAEKKKVIVVLNIGGVIETASWRDQVDAILLAWQPGQEGGNAIADVLKCEVNPSGKLASTFPIKYDDVPSAKNFPGTAVEIEKKEESNAPAFMRAEPWQVIYEEDIYVGYRYFTSFDVKPAYEFGYGLSYTNFEYGKLKLSSKTFEDTITATIEIKNTGKVAGKEVAQLYICAPGKKLEKPEIELKAFAKTILLKPGESQTLSMEIDAMALASFDTEQTAWIAEAGKYKVKVGASCLDIKKTANFELKEDLVVEKLTKALTPEVEINVLRRK